MQMIIFDDGRHHLTPMTDLRAAFEVRTAALTSLERLEAVRSEQIMGYWVSDNLQPVVSERSKVPVNLRIPNDVDVLVVNGRWVNPTADLQVSMNEAVAHEDSGDVIIAAMSGADALHFLITSSLPDSVAVRTEREPILIEYPWDVIRHSRKVFEIDVNAIRLLDVIVPSEDMAIVSGHAVEIHRTAKIYPNVVFDAEHGPIIIEENVVVRPGAILSGPCYVGPGSVVVDRAHIKSGTFIGPVCKVGGEVGATIFQGYSNKSHDGHLGDSWVGEWVNFGAGTTNSNLLNTYGEVNMRNEVTGKRHRTGMTFLGAIVGDHVKFAINTRLMTGTVIGTGSMIATSTALPTTVKPFAWLTDDGERTYKLNKFMNVAETVMARREVHPSDIYKSLLNDLHSDIEG